MPRGKIVGVVAALLSFAALTAAQTANRAAELFDRARQLEDDKNFSGAINIYEQIIKSFSSDSDRLRVARAFIRIGSDPDQRKDEAQKLCQRVLNDYADLGEPGKQVLIQAQNCVKQAAAPDAPIAVKAQYTGDPFSFAISPDGRSIILHGAVEGTNHLVLQQIDTGMKTTIPGSKGGRLPFWKPDGRAIGFFADGKLKRVDVEGANLTKLKELAETTAPFGGTWSSTAGVIVFAPHFSGPLFSVPEGGGASVPVTRVEGSQTHRFPQFHPDGRHFLYFNCAGGPCQNRPLTLGSLDNFNTQRLQLSTANDPQGARFDSAGRVLYVANGALFAQNLNSQMRPIGAAVQILDRVVATPANPGAAALSVSNGRIAYRDDTGVVRQFKWVDRKGQPMSKLGEPDRTITTACCIRLSPDDRTVAYHRGAGPSVGATWTMNAVDGIRSPTQVGPGANPAWSQDGDQLAFSNISNSAPNLSQWSPAGVQWLRQSPDREFPNDWHGNHLLYLREGVATRDDLFVLPLKNGDPVIPVANSPARELNGRFSPNGDRIVYQSDEVGDRFEIYVQAFPGAASARQIVSRNGGTNPQWRRKDGREIYFLSSDNYVMVAAVTPSADGRNIEIGTPERLFPQPVGAQFEASSDGERFLLSAPLEDSFPPILIRTNWASALNADGPPSARSPQPAPAPPALINSNVVGPNPAAGAGVQSTAPLRQITIFDKDGKPLGTVGSPGAMEALAISPDATQVAFSRGANLFVLDTRTDTTSTVTYSYVANTGFGFSPDSKSIAYVSTQDGSRALYSKFANGTGFREKLYSPALSFSNWSMDLLMLSSVNRQLALSINGDRNNPVPLVVADGNTTFRLSPDTRLLAYVSDEDGSFQVWVRPFNPSSTTQPKGAVKISTNGVTGMIRWRADGQELYYLSKDAKVIAVPITTSPEIKVGQSRELFRAPLGQPGDVSADGQRFVFLTNAPTDTPRR